MEETDGDWRGSPLDVAEDTIDASSIKEVAIEFDNGDEDVLRPKRRAEFGSYELHQMGTYLDTMAASIRRGRKN